MSDPIDPTNKRVMAFWARTPFAENDYQSVQDIQGYWAIGARRRDEIDDLLYVDAMQMYRAVVPDGFVVVRRADLAWVMQRGDRTPNPDAYDRLTAALNDGENVTEQGE